MKKLFVKIDGEWREVIYIRGGAVDLYRGQDGSFASFRLKPKDDDLDVDEGITVRSVEDIKLSSPLPEEECKCECHKGGFHACTECQNNNHSNPEPEDEIEMPESGFVTEGVYQWAKQITAAVNQLKKEKE